MDTVERGTGVSRDRSMNRKNHAPRDDGLGAGHGVFAGARGNNSGGGGQTKRLNHFCDGVRLRTVGTDVRREVRIRQLSIT